MNSHTFRSNVPKRPEKARHRTNSVGKEACPPRVDVELQSAFPVLYLAAEEGFAAAQPHERFVLRSLVRRRG